MTTTVDIYQVQIIRGEYTGLTTTTLRTILPPHNYKHFPGSKLFNQLLDCEIYSYEAFGIDRLLWVEQELDGKTHAHLVNARGSYWEYMGTYDTIAEGSCGCVRLLHEA